METEQNKYGSKEKSDMSQLTYRYMPYWPMFILLFLGFGAMAWGYIQFVTPLYDITANILIRDERKGSDNPRGVESLNAYASKKIVENEIEVIRSREIIGSVVNKQHLYAQTFEEHFPSHRSAYLSSPIVLEARNPESLQDHEKISFRYDAKKNMVLLAKGVYPLNEWVNTEFGKVRFLKNPHQVKKASSALYFSLTAPRKAIIKLQKRIDASPSSKLSTVVTLKLKDDVPERGKTILNSLIDAYNTASMNEKNRLAINTLAVVEERISYVVKELDSIENRVQSYKARKGVTDLSEQGKLFLQNVSENDRKLSSINMQLAVLNQVEKSVATKGGPSGIAPSTLGMDDPVLAQLLQKLYDTEMQYEHLKKTTPTGNPMMFSLKNVIDNVKPVILDNIKTQRVSLLASKNDLNSTNGMYASRIRTIPSKERDLLEISRQHAIKNEAYSYLLQKREETALSYASSVPDSRIVDQAEASLKPVSPKKMLIYLGALIMAFVCGIALVNSRELLSDKILFRSEIEKLTSIPVVAEIMKVKGKQPLIINKKNQEFISEQFRQLRASVGLFGPRIKNKRLLVSSSISGEGKSFISNNLALSLALSGKKVLLVDMDIRNPKTTEVFGLQNSLGVAEYLSEKCDLEEVVHTTEYNNLFLLPAGYASMNTTELLLSGRLETLFTSLQNSFDVLIMDAAPIDPVMDAFVLSEFCDFTILVVRHRYTPKTMVQLLDENNKIKILKDTAIVFNCVSQRGFVKKGYGLGYGYGYMNVYGSQHYRNKEVARTL